ncbi:chemotaxis protein [Oscillatoriales cyanobacterium USR001]|nr:chemotaxis protein [Oscillatoriales cyanobacterium USR001]
MKLSTKLYLGFFIIPALILITLSIYSISSFQRIDRQVITIYDDRIVPLQQIKQVSDSYAIIIMDSVNKAHAGLLSHKQALQDINKALQIIQDNWRAYQATKLTFQEQVFVAEAEELFLIANRKIEELKQVLKTEDSQENSGLDNFYGALYKDIDPITAKLQQLTDLQIQVAKDEREKASLVYAEIQLVFKLLLIVAVLIASPVGFTFSRSVLTAFKQTLNAVITSSTEMAVAVEEQERIAAQQASAVNQTTITMEELNVSSKVAAEQAETAARGAKEVLNLATEGTKTVARSLNEMLNLKQKMIAMQTQIFQLSGQTNQIGNISSLVSDLANQTNMLALNAAIEAVRAGSHGQGFAIIATEIRKLADQSQKSATKINSLVENIQKAINSTEIVTADGMKTIEENANISQDTADTFGGVRSKIDEVTASAQSISLNAQQQAIAIQQVVEAMKILNTAATETASGISQIKIGTQNLQEVSLALKTLV